MEENLSVSATATFEKIQSGIKDLSALVASSSFYYASTAKLPVPEVLEDGHDTAYDQVERIVLERHTDHDAIAQYIDSIQLQMKSIDYSNIAGRRTAGIVHLKVSPERAQAIADKIDEINQLKVSLEEKLTDKLKSYYERSKFYQQHFNGYLMVSVFRQIPCAKQAVKRMAFGWIKCGYKETPIGFVEAERLVKNRVEAKVRANPNLNAQDLLKADLKRLNSADETKLYFMRVTKINPMVEIVYQNEEKTTVRASVPILLLQPVPLKSYTELSDYNGVLRKTVGKKTAKRTPVIFEYGLFEKEPSKNGKAR